MEEYVWFPYRHGGGKAGAMNIWKRSVEEINDLMTREEFFNEYWWAE